MPPRAGVLRHILLLQRDVLLAAAFYERALGLRVTVRTETYAELASESPSDSQLRTHRSARRWRCNARTRNLSSRRGYSPIIHFEVDDIQARVNAALSLGGRLDGKIQHEETHGAVAALVRPDGHRIGMYERASGR